MACTNAAGDELIESYAIPSMAHGTPLATGAADDQCGATGPFLLEVGISSSYYIARFFGLAANRRASDSSRRPLGARVPAMLDGGGRAQKRQRSRSTAKRWSRTSGQARTSTPRYRCGHRRSIEKRRSLKERLAIGIIHSADCDAAAHGLSHFCGGTGADLARTNLSPAENGTDLPCPAQHDDLLPKHKDLCFQRCP